MEFSLIDSLFLPREAQIIKAIPLYSLPQKDHIYWPLENQGCYFVKSGYQMLYKGDEALTSISYATKQFWKGIWTLKVLKKIKHFMWKVCYNALPTKMNLVRRKILEIDRCQLCDVLPESTYKVEFNQPFCWFYSVPNLLVIQHLETLYLGGNHVRVVYERV